MTKTIISGVALAVALTFSLTGCVPSPTAKSMTSGERELFEKACYEARGIVSGVNTTWEVPTCTVVYQYPSIPGPQGSSSDGK
jgi:hypothetical protein